MATCILSVDIGSVNYAIGFAEFVPGGLIKILSIELFSPKPSKSTSWGAANVRLTEMLHDRLTRYAASSAKLYTVVEKQINKSRANSNLAFMTQSAVLMWSLSHGRTHDTFRYLWAPEKFIDPIPAHVRTHTRWKRHGINTIRKFFSDHRPEFQHLHDLIFEQHAQKPDDLCDCLLQLIATHHRLQGTAPASVPALVDLDDGLVDTESEGEGEGEGEFEFEPESETKTPEPETKTPKPETKPPEPEPESKTRRKRTTTASNKKKKARPQLMAGPLGSLDDYA